MGSYAVDLTGQKFGRLSVLARAESLKPGQTRWLCLCECGVKVITHASSLKNGRTKSCGCLQADTVRSFRWKHGGCAGYKIEPLHRVWRTMKHRCNNPNAKHYAHYGGRGITICEEWKTSYEDFRNWALENGYQQGLTIDRIDNDGAYEPCNCRWVSQKEQNNNTRRTRRVLCSDGIMRTLSQISDLTGINRRTLSTRYSKNPYITFEEIIRKQKK